MARTRNDLPFDGCRRAAATALTAAVMTLMSIAGIAFTSDHSHLVYQRDILKSGTDAATLATTRHLWTLDPNLSTEQIKAELMPIARRYILANIPESRRERAAETLTITLVPHRAPGTVDIAAQADLGGIIFGRWMYGNMVPSTRVGSLSELELADAPADTPTPITEVVLALDITGSMNYNPDRTVWMGPKPQRRIEIVKRAAHGLVESITADAGRTVAVGLVPWSYRVRFDAATRTRWEDLGWATSIRPSAIIRIPIMAVGAAPGPVATRTRTNPPPAASGTHLPDRNGRPWHGCVDQRWMAGAHPPASTRPYRCRSRLRWASTRRG